MARIDIPDPANAEGRAKELLDTVRSKYGATPNSMAVDRSGTAWVNYSDGRLFKVSTKDAKCTKIKK